MIQDLDPEMYADILDMLQKISDEEDSTDEDHDLT